MRLPLALWPLAIAATAAGFALLFDGDDEVPAAAVIARSVGPSFIGCGLIAWQRRPGSRTGPLMTLTGFLFLGGQLLGEADDGVLHTLGELVANAWAVPFAALVLGFPTGALTTRVDRLIVAGLAFGTVVLQAVYVLDESVNSFQLAFNGTMGVVLGVVAIARWAQAAPPLRRLLLPTLAGGVAVLVIAGQIYYELLEDEFVRTSQEVVAVVLVAVPLAFLFGILCAHYARAAWRCSSPRCSRRPTRGSSASCSTTQRSSSRSSSKSSAPRAGSSRSSRTRERGSWRPGTPHGAGSSAICTTARSNGSWRSRSRCA